MSVLKFKNAAGQWETIAAIKGDKGDPGPAGAPGEPGTTTFAGLTDVPDRVKNAISSINGATADANGAIQLDVLPASGGVISSTKETVGYTLDNSNGLGYQSLVITANSDAEDAVGDPTKAALSLIRDGSSQTVEMTGNTIWVESAEEISLFAENSGVVIPADGIPKIVHQGNHHTPVLSIDNHPADANGNVTIESVDKAWKDLSGNVITTTYATKTELANVSSVAANAQTTANAAFPKASLTYGTADMTAGTSTLATGSIYLMYE